MDYLDLLERQLDSLLTIHPRKYSRKIAKFESLIARDDINKKILVDGKTKEKSLSERIVSAMCFKQMRSKIYPHIARQMGVKTCVYCNANYAITTIGGAGCYDLDHWKPKSLYPYLSVSFYNLQIACPVCNRYKNNDDSEYFHLWTEGASFREVFRFKLDKKSVLKYWISYKAGDIKAPLTVVRRKDKKMLTHMDNRLRINKRYKEHMDVAEEVLWKKKIYNPSYMTMLRLSFKKFAIPYSYLYRLQWGTYSGIDNIHKRPLSKLIQDILSVPI